MLLDHASPQELNALSLAQTKEDIKAGLAVVAWRFFHREYDRDLLRVKKWGISFTLEVRHLKPLFELLFGPEEA